MKRRGILAGAVTGIGVTVTGVTTWLVTRENDGDEKGGQSTRESDPNKVGNDTAGDETASDVSKEDLETENESEQPEAANPEPDPQGPATNESAINESRASEEPTVSDVVVTEAELVTEPNAATVTGVARNDADEPVTIDLEVTFLKDGKQIGRPELNGTTGLPPGEMWEFSVSGRGSEYSAATGYEIAKSVRTQG